MGRKDRLTKTDTPHEAAGLPCEGVRSLSRRPCEDLTSGHRADAFEPTCSASKAQPLKSDAACGLVGPLVVALALLQNSDWHGFTS
jgi:hypothetical protein